MSLLRQDGYVNHSLAPPPPPTPNMQTGKAEAPVYWLKKDAAKLASLGHTNQ